MFINFPFILEGSDYAISNNNLKVLYIHIQHYMYTIPSILQPSLLRPPLIIRLLDLVPESNFLCKWPLF